MTLPSRILSIRRLDRFKEAYRDLPLVIKEAVDGCLRDLVSEEIPQSRCVQPMRGSNNKNIYTMKPTWNEPYLISFEVRGSLAILRNIYREKTL